MSNSRSTTNSHTHFMLEALKLARISTRKTLPNPSVGAVIVHNGVIIGRGYHKVFGGPHAEIEALQSVTNRNLLSRSTLYVTLEPCAHVGKTPPCADAIIKAKIPRVVIGCRDPFEHVRGQGVAKLRAAGIEVIENCLVEDCIELNKRFILAHRLRRPYITLKWAQTSDGFIAPIDRGKLSISGPEAKSLVHLWRGEEMAIAVGTTTVQTDNPKLTVRDTSCYSPENLPPINPLRVVIGDAQKLVRSSAIFNSEAPSLLFSSALLDMPEWVTVIPLPKDTQLLPIIMSQLYQRGILSLFVEGGRYTLEKLIEQQLWDEARVCIAPHCIRAGIPAPRISAPYHATQTAGVDTFYFYQNPIRKINLGIPEQ